MEGRERGRTLVAGLYARVTVALLSLGGCGGHNGMEPVPVSSGDIQVISAREPDSQGVQPVAGSSSTTLQIALGDDGTDDWVVPGREILDAFAGAAEALHGHAVYQPSRLPADARLVQVPQREKRAKAVVTVETDLGTLEFQQIIEGDIGDLPAEGVELAGGRRASVYSVLGGILVQWADGEDWYGVYGSGLSRDVVLAVARLCAPAE